jgi:membrane protein DedA with SNARE-associated domain
MDSLKKTISLIWLPLFAAAAVAMFYAFWMILDLPPRSEVIEIARQYFEQYGLITILIAAIIEGALFVGWYFPGSLVIVVGAVFAGKDIAQLFEVFVATTVGFWIAFTLNFFVGKYGWYKLLATLGFREALEKAKIQVTVYGPRAIFLTSFHPNLAALTATAAGVLQMPFRIFVIHMIAATILWNAFWTTAAYFFGEYSIELIGPKFVLPFIALWIAIILFRKWRKESGEATQPTSQV